MQQEQRTTAAPWLRLAAESRWRILIRLKAERREPMRRFLLAYIAHFDNVLRELRARRAA